MAHIRACVHQVNVASTRLTAHVRKLYSLSRSLHMTVILASWWSIAREGELYGARLDVRALLTFPAARFDDKSYRTSPESGHGYGRNFSQFSATEGKNDTYLFPYLASVFHFSAQCFPSRLTGRWYMPHQPFEILNSNRTTAIFSSKSRLSLSFSTVRRGCATEARIFYNFIRW